MAARHDRAAVAVTLLAVGIELAVVAAQPSGTTSPSAPALLALVSLFGLTEAAVATSAAAAFPVATAFRTLVMLLGVMFVPPVQVAAAHAVGATIGMGIRPRGSVPVAAAVLSTAVLGTTVGAIGFERFVVADDGALLQWWAASFAASALAAAVGSIGLMVAWRSSGRRLPRRTRVLAILTGTVITLATASIAMTVVIFSRTDPAELLLLLGPVAVAGLAIAAYASQRRGQEQVEFLYQSSHILDGVSSGAAMLTELLEGAVSRFRADCAELVLEDVGGRPAAAAVDRQGRVEPLGSAPVPVVRARRERFAEALAATGGGRTTIEHDSRATTAILPIADADRRIGVFALSRPSSRPWRQQEIAILQLVAVKLAARLGTTRMVEELRASVEELGRLAALVTAADDAIVGVHRDGTIASWNRGAEILFGYLAADVVGRPGGALRTIADGDPLLDAFVRAGNGELVRDLHTDATRADGSIVPVAVTMSPIPGEGGAVEAISIVARDETPRALQSTMVRDRLERFHRVFDGSTVGIGIIGAEFRWVRVNDALCRSLALAPHELVGRRFEQCLARDDIEPAHGIVSRLLRGESSGSSLEVRLRPHASAVDEHRVAALTVRPLRSADGTLQALCTLEDVTESRRAEERLRSVEARVQAAVLEMTAIREPEGVLRALLRSTREILGAQAVAVVTEHDDGAGTVLVDGAPEAVGLLDAAIDAGHSVGLPSDAPVVAGSGAAILVLRLEADGAVAGVLYAVACPGVAEFTDDDRRVATGLAAQATLSLENARAHQRALALVRELDATNSALQHASEARSRFLANVSHELRTPLHSILLAARLLRDRGAARAADRSRIRQLPGVIEASGAYLLGLIDDLIDLSRIELSDVRLHRTPVTLEPVLADLRQQMRPLAADRGVRLRVGTAPRAAVLADPLRLRQVLLNLLSNAVKYTEPGGRVWVHARPIGGTMAIDVGDTGVGIAPTDVDRAFEPFERLGREAAPGAGLGLAIARRLVELHHGTLSVQSTPGVGSVFTVTLPLADAAAQTLIGMPVRATGVAAGRVVVVDDDEIAAALLARVLEASGYDVIRAASIAETRRILAVTTTDAVILDRRLQDGDGLLLLAERDAWLAPDTLVVTVSASTADEQEAIDAGAVAHLRKPVAVDVLLHRLASAVPADPAVSVAASGR